MIRKLTPSLPDLYVADETAWLDAMAELIRSDRLTDLDYPHLAEYIEDMAKRDRREVESRLKLLLIHVLKWTYQKKKRTTSWEVTILNQQDELEGILDSGVLRNHADELLPALYAKAVRLASKETKLSGATFPAKCPWTLDQLLSEDVLKD